MTVHTSDASSSLFLPAPLPLQYRYSFGAIFAIALSCVLAYCVNLSTYLVIGRTSPVSYQVLIDHHLLYIQ